MKSARYWTGYVMSAGLAIALLLPFTDWRITSSGKVEGRVKEYGRPLAGGLIVFEPVEPERSEAISAAIDPAGYFRCDPEWRRDRWERIPYRVKVLLPRRQESSPPPTDVAPDGLRSGGASGEPGPSPGRPAPSGPITAPADLPGGTSPGPSLGAETTRDSRRPDAWTLEIWLGPEPARLEIDLAD